MHGTVVHYKVISRAVFRPERDVKRLQNKLHGVQELPDGPGAIQRACFPCFDECPRKQSAAIKLVLRRVVHEELVTRALRYHVEEFIRHPSFCCKHQQLGAFR